MQITPITGTIGARITGIDAAQPLSADAAKAIRDALDRHGAVFLAGQNVLTPEQQLVFARNFGEVEKTMFPSKETTNPEVMTLDQTDPVGYGSDLWHADATHMETPAFATILQALELPEIGGDTCFSCGYSAYEALSPMWRDMLDGLEARHSMRRLAERSWTNPKYYYNSMMEKPPVLHPVVSVNPNTGRKRLFVNSNYTIAIDGMTEAESDTLLKFLFEHIKDPRFQMRYQWSVGDIGFWDNHAVQHYAVPDYNTRRRMQRVTLTGRKPIGAGKPARIPEAA